MSDIPPNTNFDNSGLLPQAGGESRPLSRSASELENDQDPASSIQQNTTSQPTGPFEQPSTQPVQSEWDITRASLRENPRQPQVWNRLVDLAESSGDLEQIKETYEALLQAYPNTSQAQIAYINHYLNPGHFTEAQDLFKKWLKSSPSVDLWKCYLDYVRRLNTDKSFRDEIRKSFEFALTHIGQDKDSGPIWTEYIQFLKEGTTTTTWEEQQKMDLLRKVYHRAIQIPIEGLDNIWTDFEAFEMGLNKITAKKFMQDLNPAYMQARTVLRQLTKHLAPLSPPTSVTPGVLHLPTPPAFNSSDRSLAGAWKAYLKWEESNPLEIEEGAKATLTNRIQTVYRKAVISMRFFSEIWYMAHVWFNGVGKHEEAITMLKGGIEANPSSFLLNFAYAENLEVKKDYPAVHAVFEKLLDVLRKDLTALDVELNPLADSLIPASQESTDTQLVEPTNNTKANPRFQEFTEKKTEYGLAWIMYMRFARRAENVTASRAVFGKARRDKFVTWEVYEAAALMEYHTIKDRTVASRIFEKGLEAFGKEIEFVLRYLGFLISINDENNARALFERVITTFEPQEARPLWERWARYEYQYGDLEAAMKLEKRVAETYPTDPPIKRFAQRHTYLAIDAIAARDLGAAVARQQGLAISTSSVNVQRQDTVQNLLANSNQGSQSIASSSSASPATKRPVSPDRSHAGPVSTNKRQRPFSPPPRDRDRRDGPGPRKRFTSPPRGERSHDPPTGPRARDKDGKDDEKQVTLPNVLSWFVGQLPPPAAFDGPVFRTDDLMMLLRNAVIPSATRSRTPPPASPVRGGRPPPDYGPYQGPGGRPNRRY